MVGPGEEESAEESKASPPLSFKLELKVLGIEVVDADIAVLTAAAVTAWEERQDPVTHRVRSRCCSVYTRARRSLFSQPPPKCIKSCKMKKTPQGGSQNEWQGLSRAPQTAQGRRQGWNGPDEEGAGSVPSAELPWAQPKPRQRVGRAWLGHAARPQDPHLFPSG